jgi:alpha-acetolactate decarboxylase
MSDITNFDDCWTDANGRERESEHPFLVFDKSNGTVIIADDYETSNDATARDFVLTRDDAIEFAAALLVYALHGTTSTAECVAQHDVEDRIERYNKGDYTR